MGTSFLGKWQPWQLVEKSHGHQLEINGVWRDDTLCYTNEKEQKKIHYRFVSWKEGIFFWKGCPDEETKKYMEHCQIKGK